MNFGLIFFLIFRHEAAIAFNLCLISRPCTPSCLTNGKHLLFDLLRSKARLSKMQKPFAWLEAPFKHRIHSSRNFVCDSFLVAVSRKHRQNDSEKKTAWQSHIRFRDWFQLVLDYRDECAWVNSPRSRVIHLWGLTDAAIAHRFASRPWLLIEFPQQSSHIVIRLVELSIDRHSYRRCCHCCDRQLISELAIQMFMWRQITVWVFLWPLFLVRSVDWFISVSHSQWPSNN